MSPGSAIFLIWAISLEEDVAFNSINFAIIPPYPSPPRHTMAPHLTPTKKARIWQYHTDGLSSCQIADKLPWDRRTIDRTITLMKQHPDPYYFVPRPGRPRSLTPADLTFAKLSLKRGECRDGADVQRELFPNTGASTVRRALAMIGLNGQVCRKKPYLSKRHIGARRKWAIEFHEWGLPKWKAVWFADESKFDLFGSDGKLYCCRGPGEEFVPQNVRGVVKHRGGNIQVWGVLGEGQAHSKFLRSHGCSEVEITSRPLPARHGL